MDSILIYQAANDLVQNALGGQFLFAIHSLPDAPATHDIG